MQIQRQQELLVIDKAPTLRTISFGNVFSYKGKSLMRVKPTQFLLNSTLVADVLNRGDCFVVDMELGTLYIIPGDKTEVKLQDATLLIKES